MSTFTNMKDVVSLEVYIKDQNTSTHILKNYFGFCTCTCKVPYNLSSIRVNLKGFGFTMWSV